MLTKTHHSTEQVDEYEISLSLGLQHQKATKEFILINLDTGEEFLMAEDYEEAKKLCEFILKLIGENGMDEKIELLGMLEDLKSEIEEAHAHLSKYIGKEHWGLAGRIEGLIGMILRYRRDGKLDKLLDKIQAEYVKQFEGWTPEEVLKHV